MDINDTFNALRTPTEHNCDNCIHWRSAPSRFGMTYHQCIRLVPRIQNGRPVLKSPFDEQHEPKYQTTISAFSSCLDAGNATWLGQTEKNTHRHYWEWEQWKYK